MQRSHIGKKILEHLTVSLGPARLYFYSSSAPLSVHAHDITSVTKNWLLLLNVCQACEAVGLRLLHKMHNYEVNLYSLFALKQS